MLFFDFEVFIKDWLVVILDMDNRKEHVIINSPSDLKQFYQEHKTDIWVTTYFNQWFFQLDTTICSTLWNQLV